MKRIRLYGLSKYLKALRPIETKDNKDTVIMSMNVRCIHKLDKKTRNWFYRAPLLKKIIEEENPDIIGLQEATLIQLKFFKRILKDYSFEYKKRDNNSFSETNAVFYKKNRFNCYRKDTFFLSETYNVMSNTWNGKCNRICTYLYLKDLNTKEDLIVFNTHLDHISELARINGIKLIKNMVNILGCSNTKHLIMGDMNDHYGSYTINTLLDGYKDASSYNNMQNINTYNGYGLNPEKIDFIALSEGITIKDYKVINKTFNDVYPSDHNPILVKI